MSEVQTKPSEARYRIAVDTGGTFTDVVLDSTTGDMAVGKALTTYDRVFTGFEASVRRAAESVGWSGDDVLRNADVIVYGTTHATNAVLTGKVAKTALLTTDGFADTLLLREGGRRDAFDSKAAYPPPYIPRQLTFEIRERVSAEGDVLVPLDEEQAREILGSFKEQGIEAVAVSFLWSIINDVHERRVGELIEEILPGVPYTLSNEANPTIREYRRSSAASIDASLKPLMADHLGKLRSDLQEYGFAGDLLVVTSEGAVLDVADVLDRPVLLLNSGPSMAPLVGAAAAPDRDTVVVCDMGGTTFDVSLVEEGVVRHTREAWLGEPFVGHLTGLSSVAVSSIGAGGGSIAWIDGGGLLRVGPQSARSTPGPAAYGRGGEEPTVTDACVALGYLDTEGFEGGFTLDREAAVRAIDTRIAGPLKMDTLQAAQAILDVSANHMATAIRQAALEQGVDPRGALIVAGGGAGAMVAAAIGVLLEADTVLIPATAGVLPPTAHTVHRSQRNSSRRCTTTPAASMPVPPPGRWGTLRRRRTSSWSVSTAWARRPTSPTSSMPATRARRGTCGSTWMKPRTPPSTPQQSLSGPSTKSTTAATARTIRTAASKSSRGASGWKSPDRSTPRRTPESAEPARSTAPTPLSLAANASAPSGTAA